MHFQDAQKLRDALLIVGFVLMLGAHLYAPLLIPGAVTALSCVIPDYLYNKCPHCGKYLGRNTKKFCQHCGRSNK